MFLISLLPRFSNKTIRRGDNGAWHFGHTQPGGAGRGQGGSGSGEGAGAGGLEAGLEYSPGETFSTNERGGHYLSAFCPHVQVSVPPGAADRSLHVTLQVITVIILSFFLSAFLHRRPPRWPCG